VRHAENAEDLIRRVQSVIFSPQALVNAFYLSEMLWEMHGCTDEIRDLFRIRMSLVPYLFTMFYDYHTQGKPPVRALVCDYEHEAQALTCQDEYLFGDAMLVAPIITGEQERDVWLPQGEWFDFFTGQRYEGGTHHIKTDAIPVFVKGGTLLPVAEPVDYIQADTCFAITLRAYGDCTNAVCRLVEDSDETSTATYRVIALTQDQPETSSPRYRVTGVETVQ
jgi:alpha-D-xyloside xylohydrolase